jgi:hypothetical protein
LLTAQQRWVWIVLLCLARESPVPGQLLYSSNVPITVKDIAEESDTDLRVVKNGIINFIALGMLSEIKSNSVLTQSQLVSNSKPTQIQLKANLGFVFAITNWKKRQYKWDSSTPRVRNWRERKRDETVSVTHQITEVQNTEESKDFKQGETPSPLPKSLSPKKESKPKVEIPLAVETYHRLTSLYPAKSWWKEIQETVSDDPDALKLWFRIIRDWLGMGWSPKSVKLMLENFKKRQIPGEKDREWIPSDVSVENTPDITDEQAEANRKRLAEMISGVTARMTV